MSAGLSDQLLQILKMCLDPDNMVQNDKDLLLDHFYARQVGKLVSALVRKAKHPALRVLTQDCPQYQSLELLTFCAHQHGYRARMCLLNQNVIEKAVGLLKGGKGFGANVTCAVVRFVRTCIGLKEDSVVQRIVNKNALDPIMEAFVANGARYNLLNSSVIELVQMIRDENVKPLVHYLVRSRFEKDLGDIEYVSTFQELKIRDGQNSEYAARGGGAGALDGGDDDLAGFTQAGEYKYFNEDSDDDETDGKVGAEEGAGDGKREGLSKEEEENFFRQTELFRKRKTEDNDDDDLLGLVKRPKTGAGKTKAMKKIEVDLSKKRRIT